MYRLWFGPFRPVVFLVHPDTIKEVTRTAEPKMVYGGASYFFFEPWLGTFYCFACEIKGVEFVRAQVASR